MSSRLVQVALLLAAAGSCVAILDVAWFRELSLAFGSTSGAGAALLGALLVGYGAGAAVGGWRADKMPRPLGAFAQTQLALSAWAALSPGLCWLARFAYGKSGGVVGLGDRGATALRVAIALVVVGLPAAATGAGLAAAGRAVSAPEDARRRHGAVVVGAFAAGAGSGVALSSLVLTERLGVRLGVWIAALGIALVATGARRLSLRLPLQRDEPMGDRPLGRATTGEATGLLDLSEDRAPTPLVVGGTVVVAFAFELFYVVVRRLAEPLFGGSAYAHGVVLAVALVALGLGTVRYALDRDQGAGSLGRFALGCALAAAGIAIPFALGDRLAVVALLLRPMGALGPFGHVAAWGVVALVVVAPAAAAAGAQLGRLPALFGLGSHRSGRHLGIVHGGAALGALGGALTGTLAFLPLLGAVGVWRLVAAMSAALAVGAILLAMLSRQSSRRDVVATLAATAVAALALLVARGPTATWRHGQVGAGSADEVAHGATRNALRAWAQRERARSRAVVEGREVAVAIAAGDGRTLLVDGEPVADLGRAGASVTMAALLPALLHDKPTRALLLGMGSGAAAAWLAAVPSIERVTVVEPEAALVRAARELAAAGGPSLDSPKIQIVPTDPRELVATAREKWDIVVADASSPVRERAASLFTRDYYAAAAALVAPGGMFAQRLRVTEVDGQGVRSAYATFGAAFPIVETWRTGAAEILLLGSQQAVLHPLARLRQRVAEAPFADAFAGAWRVDDLEGVLARYVARPALALVLAEREAGDVATDDRNTLEYAYARAVGRQGLFDLRELIGAARFRREHRPALEGGEPDWSRVDEQQLMMHVVLDAAPAAFDGQTADERRRAEIYRRYVAGQLDAPLAAAPHEPAGPVERVMLAEALADAGDPAASPHVDALGPRLPVEAGAIAARLLLRSGKPAAAADYLVAAFTAYRERPWAIEAVVRRALELAVEIGSRDKALGIALYRALERPFGGERLEGERRRAAVELAFRADFVALCVEALAPLEPDVPWRRSLLTRRFQCYQGAGSPLAARARADLEEYLSDARTSFAQGLADTSGAADE